MTQSAIVKSFAVLFQVLGLQLANFFQLKTTTNFPSFPLCLSFFFARTPIYHPFLEQKKKILSLNK